MPYHQYTCYPAVAATAPAKVASEPAKEKSSAKQHLWLGRTKGQVLEDNIKVAQRENVWKYDPMKPSGAAPDQLFWVIELSGDTVLRTFRTIDEDLGPGKWERDPRYGNAYFIREDEKMAKK